MEYSVPAQPAGMCSQVIGWVCEPVHRSHCRSMLSFQKKVRNFSSFSGKYKRYHQENAMLENVFVTKNPIRAALFSCLLLLTMAACGGGSSSSPTPTATTPAAQFKVTSIDMAVNPTSVAGVACGTNL